MWFGVSIHSGDREFRVPDNYPLQAAGYRVDETGTKFIRVKGIRWFTNLDYPQRHETLILYRNYTEDEYPTYDNYNAINVNKTAEIPCDYDGAMGVPITFLDKYNPEQFEIVGASNLPETLDGIKPLGKEWIQKYRQQGGTGHYTANMKSLAFSGNGKNKIIFKNNFM